nr:hypothetical protein [uncultured Bdellovibrio sp.]
MKKNVLLICALLSLGSIAQAGLSGVENFANSIRKAGSHIDIGDNNCAVKVFHRQLLNSDLSPGVSRIEVRLWSQGDIVQDAVALEKVIKIDDNTVSLGKVTLKVSDDGTVVGAKGKAGMFSSLECGINK